MLEKLPRFKNGTMPSICQIDDCNSKSYCRGLCERHYGRYKRGQIKPLRKVDSGNEKERFFKKFAKDDNGCWIWQAGYSLNNKGMKYGKFHRDNKKTTLSHRFSYELHFGRIPDKAYVCHKCDVTLCVNPEHLFLGSHQDNMKDMVNKGRSYKAYGENMHTSKLTNKQALAIRISEKGIKELCAEYNVTSGTIKRIKNMETYKDA